MGPSANDYVEPVGQTRLEIEDDGVRIALEHGCFRRLTWGCHLTKTPNIEDLVCKLKERGFEDETRVPAVVELSHDAGHTVVMIPKTGRIQIRVHCLIEEADRAQTALGIAQQIAACQ